MTNQEIEEILKQAKLSIKAFRYNEAEIMASQVIDANLLCLNNSNNATYLSLAYQIQAESLIKRGMAHQALHYAQTALVYSNQLKTEDNANTLSLLGRIYSKTSEHEKATECYQQAIVLYQELEAKVDVAYCMANIGVVHFRTPDYQLALEYYLNALAIFKDIDNEEATAVCMGNIGMVYHVIADYECALEYYHNALVVHEKRDNKPEIARMKGTIGSLYRELSDYSQALLYYNAALSISEVLDLREDVAIITSNIGITYRNLLDYPRAIEYLKLALVAQEKLGILPCVAMVIGNIGITYSQMSDHHNALEYLQKAHTMFQDLKMDLDAALFSSNLGLEHYFLGNYEQALKYSEDALPALQKVGRIEESTGTMRTIGLVYASSDFSGFNAIKAEILLLKTIESYQELGAKFYLYQTHQYLANLYKQEQRWEDYATHIEKYHQLYTEVQNEEVKKQADRFGWERKIADMEKQKEIEAIKTDADKRLLEETISFQKLSLEHQAREVKNTVDELVRKNSLLQLIQSDLKKIAPHTKREGTDYIDQLLERVTRNITPLESNQQLDKQLTEVHGEFISNLHQKFPDLTTMELKIAALLSMKLTSSNIAAALFLAKRTVESHRFSLRKKMGLGTNDDIYQALAQYAT